MFASKAESLTLQVEHLGKFSGQVGSDYSHKHYLALGSNFLINIIPFAPSIY
jgi:hypothetical protein